MPRGKRRPKPEPVHSVTHTLSFHRWDRRIDFIFYQSSTGWRVRAAEFTSENMPLRVEPSMSLDDFIQMAKEMRDAKEGD